MKKSVSLFAICTIISILNANAQTKIKKGIKKEVKKELIKEVALENLFWHTNVFKANSISKKTHKPIFAFFTGSDWCGWCHKLERDVFAKQEFIKWATEKVVLLELDYPRKKQLPVELQQQNAGLQQAFQVQGYPTIWLFYVVKDTATNNVKLNALGSLGYPSNAVAGKEEVAFLETANSILAKGSEVK